MYGETSDFQCNVRMSIVNKTYPIVKLSFAVNWPLNLFPTTIEYADIWNPKSLYVSSWIFVCYASEIEQNIMSQTIQNCKRFDKHQAYENHFWQIILRFCSEYYHNCLVLNYWFPDYHLCSTITVVRHM